MDIHKLNEQFRLIFEDYPLLIDQPDLKDTQKIYKGYNKYYDPNVGDKGTFNGKVITSSVGDRSNNKLNWHYGLDLKFALNEKVFAYCSGKVLSTNPDPYGYGNYVAIKDIDGFVHVYAHLNKCLVNAGDNIKTGDIIGLAGSTGHSTGPHLHYSIWRKFAGSEKQNAIDPRLYIYP